MIFLGPHQIPDHHGLQVGVMADVYRMHATKMGKRLFSKEVEKGVPSGSTDMGNVSHIVPSIHPMFGIKADFGNHHPGFTAGAGTPAALHEARDAGKLMALTAIDLFNNPELLRAAQDEFAAAGSR
jgi:metal-dependent amidase/aminoacylase/carboxypeptidase family protein